jgi:hypothetical protein
MLSEYEASVLTKSRMKGHLQHCDSRPLAGPAEVIGLIFVGTLLLSVYGQPRAIDLGPTGVFNWDAVVQPVISNGHSVVP